MRTTIAKHWVTVLTHVLALAPLLRIFWLYLRGRYVVDPVRQITTSTGRTALTLLLLTLACRPAARILGLGKVMQARRLLGLYAFGYAGLHFLIFVGWDYGFRLDLLGPALVYQPFVVVGLVAFVLLLPLAVTSTRGWIQRLGRWWKVLHRLIYPAAALVIVHFLWLRKDPREPLYYGAVLGLLLVLRIKPVEHALGVARGWVWTRLAGRGA